VNGKDEQANAWISLHIIYENEGKENEIAE